MYYYKDKAFGTHPVATASPIESEDYVRITEDEWVKLREEAKDRDNPLRHENLHAHAMFEASAQSAPPPGTVLPDTSQHGDPSVNEGVIEETPGIDMGQNSPEGE